MVSTSLSFKTSSMSLTSLTMTSENISHCPEVYPLPYELNEPFEDARLWLQNNLSVPITSTVLYLAMIYYGQKAMADRKAYQLKWLLFAWNLGLAIFSIVGSLRLIRDMTHILTYFDFHSTVCVTGPCPVRGFWIKVFSLSKVAELGDTIFIILRKKKIIFLHVYHHVSVLFFTWIACSEGASFGRYFMGINFMVHSLMYTYFALHTLGVKPVKLISMAITSFQILQMVAGIFVVFYANSQLSQGNHCDVQFSTIRNALIMYASYFVLFVNFFIQAYIVSPSRVKQMRHEKSCTPVLTKATDVNGNVKKINSSLISETKKCL